MICSQVRLDQIPDIDIPHLFLGDSQDSEPTSLKSSINNINSPTSTKFSPQSPFTMRHTTSSFIQKHENRLCSKCKGTGHWRKNCTKSTSSSPSPSVRRKISPSQGKPTNMYKLSPKESDEDDNYHLFKAEKDELDKMADEKIENTTEFINLEPEQNHSGKPPENIKASTSKPKELEHPPRNSFYHQRAHGVRNLQGVIRCQRQRIFITKDECRLINMKRDLLMNEISFCTTIEDINGLKKKYNLK